MLVVIALGFGRSFYLRPVFNDTSLPTYLVVHGMLMTAWYLLFLVQAVLVTTGRRDLHRTLGMAGVVLSAAMVVAGVVLNLNRIPRAQALGHIASPEDLSHHLRLALDSIGSLVPFVVLIVLAVLYRRKAPVHKRLMFWAMVWMIGPAFSDVRPLGRMLDALVVPYLPYFPSDLFWLAALLAYDWKGQRRFHPATYLPFLLLACWYFIVADRIAGNGTLQEWLSAYVQARG